MTYIISVRTGGGWGSHCQREAVNLDEYMGMDDVKRDMEWLTKFGDEWRISELPMDLKSPCVVVYVPNCTK